MHSTEINTKKSPHYAWVILAGACLVMFCGYGIGYNMMSVFSAALETELEMTKAQTSSIISFVMIGSAFTMPLAGILYDRYSIRNILLCYETTMAAGFFVLSLAGTAFGCQLGGFVVGLGYGGGAVIPASLLVSNWFAGKRGLALGISSSASGVATMLLPVFLERLIESLGIFVTLKLIAVLLILAAAVEFLIIRNRPEDRGLLPYGYREIPAEEAGENQTAEADVQGKVSLFSVMKKGRTLMLFGGSFLVCVSIPPITSMLPSFLMEEGYSLSFGAQIFSIYGFALMGGKLLMGALLDRFGGFKTTLYGIGGLVLAMSIGLLVGTVSFAPYLIAVFLGLSCPLCSVIGPVWISDLFKESIRTKAFSTNCLFACLGSAVGLFMTGLLVDMTGDPASAYIFALITGLAACLLLVGAYVDRWRKGEV